MLWRAVWVAARNRLAPFVERAEACLSAGDLPEAWRAPCAYGRGHMAALDGDLEAAVDRFIEAGRLFAADPDFFLAKADDALKSTAFQSMHMLSRERFAALGGQDDAPVEPPPDWIGAPAGADVPGNDRQIMIAADPHYLKRFGPPFLESLARVEGPCALHVHLVDGGRADFDAFAGAAPAGAAIHLTGSLARSDHWAVRKPPVYASARFLAGPHIVEWLARPTLVLDIDLQLMRPIAPFFETVRTHDFCCIIRPDGGPGGYCFAAATGFAPGQGVAMARLTGAYIAARFEAEAERLWFVDQAALFRAAVHLKQRAGREGGDGFAWGDFAAEAGALTDFFEHAEETPDKRR
jgi:hypothetical protein